MSVRRSTARLSRSWWSAFSRAYDLFAARPVAACTLVGVAALILAAASTAAHGYPLPSIHDEFSYLLGAETFAQGRLTNPTHPMWRFFETFHVLQQPTYTSKYPPANAAFIAAGWAVTGHPIVGVWISFAFMCVSLCWMLRLLIGERAGLAVALASASWMATSYWGYTYWGGAVAAGAGALLLGAVHRLVQRRGGAGSAVVLGAALILLANSRPYEGALLAAPLLALLGRKLWRDRATWKHDVTGIVLPLLAVLVVGMMVTGAYNKAVTGSWRTMPYSLYQQTREGTPIFIWKAPPPLTSNPDRTVQAFGAQEDSNFRAARTLYGRAKLYRLFAEDFFGLIVPVALVLPWLLVLLAVRDRWARYALYCIVWTVIGMGLVTYSHPHYAAPLAGCVLVIYGSCIRWLSRLRFGRRRLGEALAAATVIFWFLLGLGNIAEARIVAMRPTSRAAMQVAWPTQRQLIADTLSHGGQRVLVIVRYGGTHAPDNEWVYNSANIDRSAVVWARDKGDPGNRALLDYFHDRAAWLVTIDRDTGPFLVTPYISANP